MCVFNARMIVLLIIKKALIHAEEDKKILEKTIFFLLEGRRFSLLSNWLTSVWMKPHLVQANVKSIFETRHCRFTTAVNANPVLETTNPMKRIKAQCLCLSTMVWSRPSVLYALRTQKRTAMEWLSIIFQYCLFFSMMYARRRLWRTCYSLNPSAFNYFCPELRSFQFFVKIDCPPPPPSLHKSLFN